MFDDFEGRLYHEVLLEHQRDTVDFEECCICGWRSHIPGITTFKQHLANRINQWVEANFILIDKV